MNFIRIVRDGEDCEFVGEARPDIAGIGIIVGFVGQALISLCVSVWVFFLSKHGNLDLIHPQGTIEHDIERKRLGFASDMLMIGNDIQMLLGMSYMMTIFTQAGKLDLYHIHLAYDVVIFVGVSNAAAMVCYTFCKAKLHDSNNPKGKLRPGVAYLMPRHSVTLMFMAAFIGLTVLLCVRLAEWAPDEPPGRCYHAELISAPSAHHPASDFVYVSCTASWMVSAMACAMFLNAKRRRWILISAFLQFPVHLYMAVALRTSNQGYLEGEDTDENGWDFGQTTAILLLFVSFVELYTKWRAYITFEREARRRQIRTSSSRANVDGTSSPGDERREEVRPQSSDGMLEAEKQTYVNPALQSSRTCQF